MAKGKPKRAEEGHGGAGLLRRHGPELTQPGARPRTEMRICALPPTHTKPRNQVFILLLRTTEKTWKRPNSTEQVLQRAPAYWVETENNRQV